ncbi:DUF192 domain-containing protein [Halomonas sp. PGE1]|jgi:hypothetical protein|uniref:DUF192 domain-containing protein n=1 Tax=Halomonas sp. PGE1 TaxID=2730360 RepID=UPI0014735240|nr:DUF192 domain-containing protein [Halomonas sp. PGE1]QJR00037.1 DUF192 domain-containing protein [Halomonas sp. PGE1]
MSRYGQGAETPGPDTRRPQQGLGRVWLGIAGLVVLLALSPALLAEARAPSGLAVVPLTVHAAEDVHRFEVEVARTIPERSRGLMERDHLDEDAGMLFLYRDTQSPRNGFWMYRTLIPLDIAFIGEDERIAAVFTMWPCGSANPSECPVTYPGVPYRAALEVNAGLFERLGIAEGDCVSWPSSVGHCLSSAAEEGMGPAE